VRLDHGARRRQYGRRGHTGRSLDDDVEDETTDDDSE